MHPMIQEEIQKLATVLLHIQNDRALLETMEQIAQCCIKALQNGKKILFAGNGGSAADAQHLVTELVTRLRYDRPGLAALALTTDTSALTAIGNDYAFEQIFSRQVEAIGQAGDVLVGISTSGKSKNVLRALEVARDKQLVTIGFTGMRAPLMQDCCDYVIHIPSTEIPKIQECHIMFGHILCSLIEDAIYGAAYDPKQQQLHGEQLNLVNE